jgi:hypothetical protein
VVAAKAFLLLLHSSCCSMAAPGYADTYINCCRRVSGRRSFCRSTATDVQCVWQETDLLRAHSPAICQFCRSCCTVPSVLNVCLQALKLWLTWQPVAAAAAAAAACRTSCLHARLRASACG